MPHFKTTAKLTYCSNFLKVNNIRSTDTEWYLFKDWYRKDLATGTINIATGCMHNGVIPRTVHYVHTQISVERTMCKHMKHIYIYQTKYLQTKLCRSQQTVTINLLWNLLLCKTSVFFNAVYIPTNKTPGSWPQPASSRYRENCYIPTKSSNFPTQQQSKQ